MAEETIPLRRLEAEPHPEGQQCENVLRLGPQQPRQRRDARPPEQDGIGSARRQVVDLTDQGDVCQEQPGAQQMQRFAGLPIVPADFAQPPPARVRAEHQRQPGADLQSVGDFIPVRRNQQHGARSDEHRAQGCDNHQKPSAALVVEVEMFDNFLPLFLGDEAGIAQFLDFADFHVPPALA